MAEEQQAEGTPSEESGLAEIDAKFDEIYGGGEPTFQEIIDAGAADEKTEQTEQTEETKTPDTPQTEGPGEAKADTTESESPPQVDPSLVALAVQEGADPAQLDELVKNDPEGAKELLSELATVVNSQTLRALQEQAPTSAEVVVPKTADATSKEETKTLSPLELLLSDKDALAAANEEFGEALVTKFLLPQAEQAKQVREMLGHNQLLRADMEAAKEQAMIVEIDATFSGFGVGYNDFYGEGFSQATEAQHANRQQVTEIADKLRSYDFGKGSPVKSVQHYLTQAHCVVSADQQKTAVRKELLSKIETRSKSHTARPSRGSASALAGGSEEEVAMNALTKKATELGVEDYFDG